MTIRWHISAMIIALAVNQAIAADKLTTYGGLTDGEWQNLQQRSQKQTTDVINTDHPEQQHLLTSPSRPIDAAAVHLDELLEQMRKAMLANTGNGLTAVQIGIPVRVVLVQRNINGKRFYSHFINPEIVRTSTSKHKYWERCLSLPHILKHLTERPTNITIRYQKTDGQSMVETFDGVDSALVQQELDHLNGVLITDHHL